jgi:hypothetical protein
MLYNIKGIDKLLEIDIGDRIASKDKSIASNTNSNIIVMKERITTRNYKYIINDIDLRKYIII